jgi:hypothetical protein
VGKEHSFGEFSFALRASASAVEHETCETDERQSERLSVHGSSLPFRPVVWIGAVCVVAFRAEEQRAARRPACVG